MSRNGLRRRPLIAFFDYPFVFEDFYPHYGVDQRAFATTWAGTGNHAYLTVVQREIADVIWYVFTLEPQHTESAHEVVGCRVKFVPTSRLHRWVWRTYYLHPQAWRWRRSRHIYDAFAWLGSYSSQITRRFLSALWRDRPDAIFVQDYASGRFDVLLLLARLMRIPLVAYHSGSTPEEYVGRFAKRWTIRHADRLLVSSRDELEMLVNRFGVRRRCVEIALTPIDSGIYRPMARVDACAKAGFDPARRYLLFVGRLVPVKRVAAIVNAFAAAAAAHDDADLVIVGTGSDSESLRALSEAVAPGRVRFLGWLADTETKAAVYNVADCLVLASRREGFPTVVGEALACGTPVLATRVGGIPELVIEGETGWLVPPDDDRALADRLKFILSHRGEVRAMRPRARDAAVRRLSPSVLADQLRHCFAARPNA